MPKIVCRLTAEELERQLTEMQEHGGEFVALDAHDVGIAYAPTEEELEVKLQAVGLRLCDVCVSRVMEYGVSYL